MTLDDATVLQRERSADGPEFRQCLQDVLDTITVEADSPEGTRYDEVVVSFEHVPPGHYSSGP